MDSKCRFPKLYKKSTSRFKDATQQLKFDFRFLLTYGAGIGAILKSVYEYLEGNFIGLSTNEISGLTVMAVAVVFYEYKDLKKHNFIIESIDDKFPQRLGLTASCVILNKTTTAL